MKKIDLPKGIKQITPILIALFFFAVLLISSYTYSNYKKDLWEKDVKSRLYELMMTKTTKLEIALYSRIHYTKSVAAYVSVKPNITEQEFQNLAQELIRKDSVISTMSISKDCIISAIYPKLGHESALGLNLLAHPKRKEIVEKTIETHKTFIAGPVDLIEGGVAFISYTPIFDKTKKESEAFWGVTDIVIYKDMLIRESTLLETEMGFDFALRGYNGLGDEGDVWWGRANVFDRNPIKIDINLPYGSWVLAAVPEKGWSAYLKQDKVLFNLLILSSFVISLLIGFISRAVVRIKRNEQELSAIFRSMNSLIFEFDKNGKYIKIPPINADLLVRPKEELINKTIFEVLPHDLAIQIHQAISRCLQTKKLVEIEYALKINGEEKWFASRVSWKSEESVISNTFDITDKKIAHEEILSTGQRLKELNATKDKFFSIIAHDLKSPFNIILGYSDLLMTSYDQLDDQKRKKYIVEIEKSSNNAFKLLENLLLWAQTQGKTIEMKLQEIPLRELVMESIVAYLPGAEKKDIDVQIDIPDEISIYADKQAMRTVIANLFDNAVKFTPHTGEVRITAQYLAGKVEIRVADTGVGVKPEVIPHLFKIEENSSTLGTDKEKGTGLGLVLCKEFVEKHGGEIRVESKVADLMGDCSSGTTFVVNLPFNS